MFVWLHNCGSKVEPCAEDILPAAARRLIMTGGGGVSQTTAAAAFGGVRQVIC